MKPSLAFGPFVLGCFFLLTATLRAQSPATAPKGPPPPPPESHQFDFWLGEWNVFANGTDKQIGESRVESVVDGWALLENWTTGGQQGTGKSLNSFNRASGQWQQYWVGGGGGISFYKGGLVDGKIVMIADAVTPKGPPYQLRGTWTPNADGSVRQEFDLSTDGGKTWQPNFDGLYKRKPKK